MTKTTCDICKVRPSARDCNGMCTECFTEGGWENEHNDCNHDAVNAKLAEINAAGAVALRKLASGVIKNANKFKSADLRAGLITVTLADAKIYHSELEQCWVCHPELNEALKAPKAKRRVLNPSTERKSRVGQVVNVPVRAPGIIKAEVVKNKIDKPLQITINEISGGAVSLLFTEVGRNIRLVWDAEGRYDYANSLVVVDGETRKVRNVAEALRLIKG